MDSSTGYWRYIYIFFLLQLFDEKNHVNQDASNYIFSTEGHIFRLDTRFRKSHVNVEAKRFGPKGTRAASYTRSPGRHNDSIGVCKIYLLVCLNLLHGNIRFSFTSRLSLYVKIILVSLPCFSMDHLHLKNSFVRSFVRLLDCSFVLSLACLSVRPSVRKVRSLVRGSSQVHSFVSLQVNSFVRWI